MYNSVNVIDACRRVHEKQRSKEAQVEADGQDSVSLSDSIYLFCLMLLV